MCLAIPGKVLEISGEDFDRQGTVDFEGIKKTVNLAFTPDVSIGEYVMVHVGFSIAKVNEEQAKRVFETLNEIESLDELQEET